MHYLSIPVLMLLLYFIYVFSSTTFFFFFNDTATTEIYTLSLHDALPIYRYESVTFCPQASRRGRGARTSTGIRAGRGSGVRTDRKSTRLNSSHPSISYAVFCLKKKKKQ